MAEPWAAPGDVFLRQDLELLSDSGVLNVPITSWPISWGDLARAIGGAQLAADAPAAVVIALERARGRARAETSLGYAQLEYGIAAAKKPRRLRLFEDSPRAIGEIFGSLAYTWERFSGRAEFTYAVDPSDNRNYRFDGSYVSYIWGNTTFNLGWQDKWWGPGWDGALALSTNARPVPGLLVKRNFTDPFVHRWLSWIGPWTASFFIGELESGRGVPNTRFLGGRFAFRPLQSLEIGLVRTAQWGGDGRDESFDSFIDLVLGRDNVGDDNISGDNEPGNQLAGFDWRWRIITGERPVVFYGQLIGEDEAGGFPSRYLGQLGLSVTTPLGDDGASLHAHLEFSDTTCQFHESSKIFNCAYNNSLFPSGYRYRGRSIGHSTDNDTRQFSLSATLLQETGRRYTGSVRFAEVNRGGPRDEGNTLSPVPSDLINVELSHEREFFNGRVTVGVGVDAADSDEGGLDGTDFRAFAEWKRQY